MLIKKIKVSNFKTFNDIDIELDKFNLLIGANASGKSNFIAIFSFLRDIVNEGLDNAIAMQGGFDYLTNTKIGTSKELSMTIVFQNPDISSPLRPFESNALKETKYFFELDEAEYSFSIKCTNRDTNAVQICEDKLRFRCTFSNLQKKEKETKEEKIGQGEFIVSKVNDKIDVSFGSIRPDIKMNLNPVDLFPILSSETKLGGKESISKRYARKLLLETEFLLFPFTWAENFGSIPIYDFDSRLPKKAAPITGKKNLEEDGSNLAMVLKFIMNNEKKEEKLCALIKDLLPFANKWTVQPLPDKSILFKLKETYDTEHEIPASMLSDGTISILSSVIALFFERGDFMILEEPERNIHPKMISILTERIKEASERKQIIVTTHNPEMVKQAGLEHLLIISRNKEGFSVISRPKENEEVKIFLENELGLDELFIKNLLSP